MGPVRRRVALFAVVALTVLALAEGGARLLGPYLTEPLTWPDRSTQVKAQQVAARGCTDVVFAGNSMARDGLAPAVFEDADPSGRQAYNAALDAATPEHLADWLTDEVVPALDPDVVVLAVSTFDLNRNNRAGTQAYDAYQASLGGRTDRLARLERSLEDRSALFRYRALLRQPTTVWHALDQLRRGDREPRDGIDGIPGLIDADGHGLSRAELRFHGESATTRFLTDDLLADFAVSPAQVASAQTLVEDLQDEGVEVVLLMMPVTDEFVALHPHGATDVAAARDAVADVATRTGAPLLDLVDAPYGDELFADTHHLNATGAERLTREVAAALPAEEPTCP